MLARVARFAALEPLAIQADPALPIAARDVIYARKLLSVIGLEGNATTPINRSAPICGAGGITMTLAVYPPGQGPGLHSHAATFETFTVLQGIFEIAWNDDGADRVVLERWDTVSIPPGVCRAFRNLGPGEGVLQVIISGGVHDMNDIAFRPSAAAAIAEASPEALARFKAQGFRFDAGA
jgi:quercetin dioxygenase-like cupin family protein